MSTRGGVCAGGGGAAPAPGPQAPLAALSVVPILSDVLRLSFPRGQQQPSIWTSLLLKVVTTHGTRSSNFLELRFLSLTLSSRSSRNVRE